MKPAGSQSVEHLLEAIHRLGEVQFQIVAAVRELVSATIQPLTEEVKFGGIMFTSTIPFAGVFAYNKHVSVEFSLGARINDAAGFLEGAGKGRRHLKLRTVQDITGKQLAAYLPLALEAAADQTGPGSSSSPSGTKR